MTKQFAVYETLNLVHYVDANTPEEAREKVQANGPLNPPPEFDTDIDKADITAIIELDEEEV